MYGKCLFKGNSFYFRYFDGSHELKIITFESAYTNLELELSQIKRMIRKSFRSLINWGGKILIHTLLISRIGMKIYLKILGFFIFAFQVEKLAQRNLGIFSKK